MRDKSRYPIPGIAGFIPQEYHPFKKDKMKKKILLILLLLFIIIFNIFFSIPSKAASRTLGVVDTVFIRSNWAGGVTYRYNSNEGWQYKGVGGWAKVSKMNEWYQTGYSNYQKNISKNLELKTKQDGLTYFLDSVIKNDSSNSHDAVIKFTDGTQLTKKDIMIDPQAYSSGLLGIEYTKTITPTPTPTSPSPTPSETGTPTPAGSPSTPGTGGAGETGGSSQPENDSSTDTSGAGSATWSNAPDLKLDNPSKINDLSEIWKKYAPTIVATIGIIAFMIVFAIAGLKYITSAGYEEQMEQAKNTLWNAITGIIVIALAAAAVNWFMKKSNSPTFNSTPRSTSTSTKTSTQTSSPTKTPTNAPTASSKPQ